MDRQSMSITVSFDAQNNRAIKTKIIYAFKGESSADTVKNKGPPTSKKITCCSSKAAIESPLVTSQSEDNCKVVVGTDACNCGVSSEHTNDTERHGTPRNMLDLRQELGRADRENNGKPGDNDHHLNLSLDLFVNLCLQVMETNNATDRGLILSELFEVIEYLVAPKQCYHVLLEEKLEDNDAVTREPYKNRIRTVRINTVNARDDSRRTT